MKGIIFDLDGVLVSTDELHFKAWGQLAKSLGITDFTKADNERQKGISRMASLEVLLEKTNQIYSGVEKQSFAQIKNTYYVESLEDLGPEGLLPGVIEVIKNLKSKGLLIGLGSASKNAPLILEKTGLMPYMDQISCGLDTNKSKPEPDVFLIAASKLSLTPNQCLVVEDSRAGILAAKAAGMKTLAVGPEYDQIGGDYCAKSLEAFMQWDDLLK